MGDAPASEFELIVDCQDAIGEGPISDATGRVLYWVDYLSGVVHELDLESGALTDIHLEDRVTAVCSRSSGGLLVATQDGLASLDKATSTCNLVVPIEQDQPSMRPNDGKCDSSGRFWTGTMSDDHERPLAGSIYRIDSDHTVTKVAGGVTLANGLGWSPDDTLMYFVDSRSEGIDVFDFDAVRGELEHKRQFVRIEQENGIPDGMAVDTSGFVWVALCFGSELRRYAPDGSLDRVVRMPMPLVTSCNFAGPDWSSLYVTTGAVVIPGVVDEQSATAGGLFRLPVAVPGMAPHSFGG